MYRTTGAMIEGWTKNLALLFDNALATALWRALDIALAGWAAVAGSRTLERAIRPACASHGSAQGGCLALLWVRNLFRFYARVAKSNFPFVDCALSPLGIAAVCRGCSIEAGFSTRLRSR